MKSDHRRIRSLLVFAGTFLLGIGGFVAPSWAQGKLFVSNYGTSTINVYPRNANGVVAPLLVITEGVHFPASIRISASARELFVLNSDSITVYDCDTGVLKRTLAGPSTGLNNPEAIALDEVNGEIYVTTSWASASPANSIAVFDISASGDVPRKRLIQGSTTGLSAPSGIEANPVFNEIVVVSHDTSANGIGTFPHVSTFDRMASGDVAPKRTLGGPQTGFNLPLNIVLDPVHEEIIVASSAFKFPDAGQILSFPASVSGDLLPIRRLSGDNTGLCNPIGLALDTVNDRLIVTNSGIGGGTCGETIETFVWPSAVENQLPLLTILDSNGVPGQTAPFSVAILDPQATASVIVQGFTGVYDGQPHRATGSATGVHGEDLSGLLQLGAGFTGVPGGTAHWTFAGNADYLPASGDAAIVITQRAVTVSANPASKVYGAADPALTGQITSGSLAAGDGFSGSLSRAAGSNVGSYAIQQGTLTLGGNYSLGFVGASLNITKAVLTITADNKTSVAGAPLPAFTATYAGFVLGESPAALGGGLSFATAAMAGSPAGTYSITPKGVTSGNYAITFVNGTLTVTPVAAGVLKKFVAFSVDSTWLRAGSKVVTGDVGANLKRQPAHGHEITADDGGRDDVTVRVGLLAAMQQSSSRVVGNTVLTLIGSSVYNVQDNFLLRIGGTVLGTVISTMPIPYLTLPALPVITPGSQNITVAANASLTLAAGSYGDIQVMNGGTLILSGGTYNIRSLDVGLAATLKARAATQLRVKRDVSTGAQSKVIVDPTVSGLKSSQFVISVESGDSLCRHFDHDVDGDFTAAVVQIGSQSTVQANIYAPNGTVWLKWKTKATGAFIGDAVRIGVSAELTLDSAF